MKVTVDYDVCVASGTCAAICPEVFELRDDGYLYVLQEQPDEALRATVQDAQESCPTGAIFVEG